MITPSFHNAVVTGACGGLGQALARALIDRGARVALVGLQRPALETLASLAPGRCAIYQPDVSDSLAMQAMAADWMGRFGTPDLVIANAGVAGGFDTAQAGDLAVMRRMLEINLLGVATTFQPFLEPMRTSARRGALVGVASVAGWRGMPGNGAYCASKAALHAISDAMRMELAPFGFQVTTVQPGAIQSNFGAAATANVTAWLADNSLYAAIRDGILTSVDSHLGLSCLCLMISICSAA